MPKNFDPKRYTDDARPFVGVTVSNDGDEITLNLPASARDKGALREVALSAHRHFTFAMRWLQSGGLGTMDAELLQAIVDMAAADALANIVGVYKERAQRDPAEAPFVANIPGEPDAFQSWISEPVKLLQTYFAELIEKEDVDGYIQTHVVAWALKDLEDARGREALEAMPDEDFGALLTKEITDSIRRHTSPVAFHYSEAMARHFVEALNPRAMPLRDLRAFLRPDPEREPVPMPTPEGEYLTVFSPPHYQALREALATKDFHKIDGIPWPTALLNRGGARGQAQLRPAAADGLMPPEEVAAWQKVMWRQREELSDLDADVLDALAANWLQQARGPNEDAVADVDGLLAMRGLKAKRGGSGTRGGYRPEQRRAILQALSHIQNLWIDMAEVEVYEEDGKGRRRPTKQAIQSRPFVITDRMGQLRTDGYIDVLGHNHRFIYRPGAVFARFLMGAGRQTALLSAKALHFDPERQKPEKRLTRYLSWQWRARAHKGTYLQAYRVQTLLRAAGLEEGRRRGARTRERLEQAFDKLQAEGVVSAWQYERWDEATAERRDWFSYWLQATVVVEPPDEVLQHYQPLLKEAEAPEPRAVAASNLGKRVRERRQQLGLTQLAAAEQIGISRSYLARIESGSSKRIGKKAKAKLDAWMNA